MPVCPICSSQFEFHNVLCFGRFYKTQTKQIYCSAECKDKIKVRRQLIRDRQRRAERKAAKQTVPCAMCGADIIPKSELHRFCSDRCRYNVEQIRARKRYKLRKLRQNVARQNDAQTTQLTLE